MITGFLGIVLGLVIGMACRWFDIPLPAPPKLVGALLVVAMTAGFVGTGLITDHQNQSSITEVLPQGDNHEQP